MFFWTRLRYEVLRTLDPHSGRSLGELTRELSRKAGWWESPRFIVALHLRHLVRHGFAREEVGMGLAKTYYFKPWWAEPVRPKAGQ